MNYGDEALAVATRRLKPWITGIDPDDVTDELTLASRVLRTEFVSIGPYDALVDTDQEWFDVATGTLAAIRLIGNAWSTANDGLSKLRTPDYEYTFVAPDKDAADKLLAEMQQALSFLSPLQDDRIALAAEVSVFGVAGRSRARECTGRPDLPTIIASLLPSGWGGDRPARSGIIQPF